MIDGCSQFMTSLNNNGLFSEIQEILKINPLCSLDKDLIHFYKSYWTNIMSYYTQYVLQRAGFINMYHLLDYLNCHNKPIYYLDSKLVEFDEVWCAAGTPSSLFKLKTEDLLNVTEAKIINIL